MYLSWFGPTLFCIFKDLYFDNQWISSNLKEILNTDREREEILIGKQNICKIIFISILILIFSCS